MPSIVTSDKDSIQKKQEIIFKLRTVDRKSFREIAQMMESTEDMCKSLYSRIEPILRHRSFNCCCVFSGGKCVYFCGACIERRSEYEERWARRHMHAVAAMNGTRSPKFSKTHYNEMD